MGADGEDPSSLEKLQVSPHSVASLTYPALNSIRTILFSSSVPVILVHTYSALSHFNPIHPHQQLAAQHSSIMSTLSKRKSEILYELIRNKLDPDKDNKIKLAGIDVDGTLRGKIISLDKFASVVKDGFGFCSVVFGWDLHDQPYVRELGVSNKANGYRDITAKIDLDTVRRIPWEDNIPFFLCTYIDPDTDKPVAPCPRGLLKTAVDKIGARGIRAMAGGELLTI